MDIDTLFPLKVCANLDRAEDRRRLASEQFRMHHLKVHRIAGFDAARLRRSSPYATAGERACAGAIRLAIRLAQRTRAPALLYFEDDVVLHDEFGERCVRMSLPDDWQLFYFGCLHRQAPAPACPGVVRVTEAYDTHALAIRASAYKTVLDAICPVHGHPGCQPPPDVRVARLHRSVPTYAAWPNLAWQRNCVSLRTGIAYSNYDENGSQILWQESVGSIDQDDT